MILDLNQFQLLLDKNLEIKMQSAEIKKAVVRSRKVWDKFVPHTYFFAGIENEKEKSSHGHTGTGSGIGFNLNLFSGFRDFYEVEINTKLYEIELNKSEIMERTLLTKTRELYFELLELAELDKIFSDELKECQFNEGAIKKKISGGILSSKELLENKIISLDIKSQQAQNTFLINQKKIEFAKLFNNELNPLALDSKIIDSGLGELAGEKISTLSQKNIQLEQRVVDFERSKFSEMTKVSIDFYGEYAFTKRHMGDIVNDSLLANRVVGLKLVFNLSESKKLRSIEEQLRLIELEKQKIASQLVDLQIEAKKKDDLNQLSNIENQIEIMNEKTKVLGDLYQSTLLGFRNGTKDSSVLNETTKQKFQALKELLHWKIVKLKIKDQINL